MFHFVAKRIILRQTQPELQIKMYTHVPFLYAASWMFKNKQTNWPVTCTYNAHIIMIQLYTNRFNLSCSLYE